MMRKIDKRFVYYIDRKKKKKKFVKDFEKG